MAGLGPNQLFRPAAMAGITQIVGRADTVLLKSFNIAAGVSAILLTDPVFSLNLYRRLLFRVRNLDFYLPGGACYLTLMLAQNGITVPGSYPYYSVNTLSSGSTVVWSNSTSSAPPLNVTPIDTPLKKVPTIDIVLDRVSLMADFVMLGSAVNPSSCYIKLPSALSLGPADYHGIQLGIPGAVFTAGTIDVFGEQA